MPHSVKACLMEVGWRSVDIETLRAQAFRGNFPGVQKLTPAGGSHDPSVITLDTEDTQSGLVCDPNLRGSSLMRE